LTSIEMMHALCSPHESVAADPGMLESGVQTLLDLTSDMILLVDRDLALIAASRPARGYFGEIARPGVPLAEFMRTASAALLGEAVDRVLASGLTEEIEIAAPFAGHSIAVAIDAIAANACLRIRDITIVDELAAIRAVQLADADALNATGLAAIGRVNLRGYLEPPYRAIAAMAGVEASTLANVRFVALIALGTRIAVGQALESAIDTRAPVQVDADILVSGAIVKPVRLAFSPIGRGSIIDGVSMAVIAR
jgi:hypothetical protein